MKLYGFFYNSMIYESAPALISLHTTKVGAWRALRKYVFQKAMDDRESSLSNPYCKHDRGSKGWMSWAAWCVEEVEVSED